MMRPACPLPGYFSHFVIGFVFATTACGHLRAQGVLQFENMSGAIHRAPVFGVDACGCAKTGNSASGIPTGNQTYTGTLLAGTGFTIELLLAPSEAPDSALAPVARTTFFTSPLAGFFIPVNVAPAVQPGATVKCQARAWDNMSGTVTSWSQAQCAGTRAGSSDVFTAGPISASGSVMTTNLRSFCLVQLPGTIQAIFLNITRNSNTTVLDRFNVNHLMTGDDVSLTATGPSLQSPTLRLQWRHNDADLQGATNATLDLDLVDAGDTGNYSLLATDSGCSRELTFQLQVHPPPSLSHPRVDAQGKFFVTVTAAPFRGVILETSTNLDGWAQASTGTTDANGKFEFGQAFPASPTGRFVRARAAP